MGVSTSVPREGVALVTVDFPPVNALPVQGWYDLAAAVRAAGADPDIRCVVLAAEGRGFNAGVDIKEMQRTADHSALIGANRGCAAAFAAVYECEVPVIAAVHGHCLGGGLELALQCPLRIASERASFGLPEVAVGSIPAVSGLHRLLQAVPSAHAMQMVLSADRIDAAHAARIGLVSEVLPDAAALAARANELARLVASHAPLTLQATKEALYRIKESALGGDADKDLILRCYMSSDFREGMEAFLTKRVPVWRGQ